MPSTVGGFGKKHIYSRHYNQGASLGSNTHQESKYKISQLGPYLAGLIEGDGTFAIHDNQSTAKKYSPKIIIVFREADLPLAQYLRNLTACGNVYIKQDRGYVL